MEDRIVRRQDFNRRFLHRDAGAAQIRWIRREFAVVKVTCARVVLHDQRAASRNEIQQLLVICRDIFLRVVGANAQHHCPKLAQVLRGEFFWRNHGNVHPDLLQHRRNVVPSSHDVSDLQVIRNFHVDDAHAL